MRVQVSTAGFTLVGDAVVTRGERVDEAGDEVLDRFPDGVLECAVEVASRSSYPQLAKIVRKNSTMRRCNILIIKTHLMIELSINPVFGG